MRNICAALYADSAVFRAVYRHTGSFFFYHPQSHLVITVTCGTGPLLECPHFRLWIWVQRGVKDPGLEEASPGLHQQPTLTELLCASTLTCSTELPTALRGGTITTPVYRQRN